MEEMDEVAVLVEKIMPIKQSQGVTYMGRTDKKRVTHSWCHPNLVLEVYETQPRGKKIIHYMGFNREYNRSIPKNQVFFFCKYKLRTENSNFFLIEAILQYWILGLG
jgi:hypothetical protein